MSLPVAREAGTGDGVRGYQRHRSEHTLLYQLIAQYYPAFADLMAAQGKALPDYVLREFEDYLKCGCLEHGFLRVRCTSCHQEHLVAFSWPRLRIPAPAAFVNPFTSQAAGLLSELWRPAHGRRLQGCRR
jgi:hypothetical protein